MVTITHIEVVTFKKAQKIAEIMGLSYNVLMVHGMDEPMFDQKYEVIAAPDGQFLTKSGYWFPSCLVKKVVVE